MRVHQIWIGNLANLQEKERAYMDTVRKWCEQYDHSYTLWLSEDIKRVLKKQGLSLREDCHPVTITDAARITILYEEGGLYLDNDVEVREVEKWEDYISAFPKEKLGYQRFWHTGYWCCLGVIFSSPENPALEKLMTMVRSYYPSMNPGGDNMESGAIHTLDFFKREKEDYCQGFEFSAVGFCDSNSFITHWHSASWGTGGSSKTGNMERNYSLHL